MLLIDIIAFHIAKFNLILLTINVNGLFYDNKLCYYLGEIIVIIKTSSLYTILLFFFKLIIINYSNIVFINYIGINIIKMSAYLFAN